jgi:hypothetical protein
MTIVSEYVLRPVFRTLLSNAFVEAMRLVVCSKAVLVDQHQTLPLNVLRNVFYKGDMV